MHRFRDDPEWGELLMRFRDGNVTASEIDKINECVVDSNTVLPENIRYATYFNRDRDSINAGLFEERCKSSHARFGHTRDASIVFCSNVQVQNHSKTYDEFRNCMTLWENCGEDDIKLPRGKGRMDPALRLYKGCQLMLPCNNNVTKGQANGTQAILEKIVLKPGEMMQEVLLDNQIPVAAVSADKVAFLVLRHCNDRISPPTFSVQPKMHSLRQS